MPRAVGITFFCDESVFLRIALGSDGVPGSETKNFAAHGHRCRHEGPPVPYRRGAPARDGAPKCASVSYHLRRWGANI